MRKPGIWRGSSYNSQGALPCKSNGCGCQSSRQNLILVAWVLFLESPDNFSGPESYFMSASFVLEVQILLVFKARQ